MKLDDFKKHEAIHLGRGNIDPAQPCTICERPTERIFAWKRETDPKPRFIIFCDTCFREMKKIPTEAGADPSKIQIDIVSPGEMNEILREKGVKS